MRLNIFSVPEVEAIESKLQASRMDVIEGVDYNGWHGVFCYSSHPTPGRVAWAETYRSFFQGQSLPENRTYFAAYLLTKGSSCYALSYGMAHSYIGQYSDYDFGIELAKRMANEADMRQTASRRFQGRRKEDIGSYASNTALDVESGESVIISRQVSFQSIGRPSARPASSSLLPWFYPTLSCQGSVSSGQAGRPTQSSGSICAPRTTLISEKDEAQRYDELLLDELPCLLKVYFNSNQLPKRKETFHGNKYTKSICNYASL